MAKVLVGSCIPAGPGGMEGPGLLRLKVLCAQHNFPVSSVIYRSRDLQLGTGLFLDSVCFLKLFLFCFPSCLVKAVLEKYQAGLSRENTFVHAEGFKGEPHSFGRAVDR